MWQVPTDIVNIKTNEVSKSMRHEEETNTLFHHLANVASQAAELDEALKNGLLSQLVAIDPVDSGSEFSKDGAGRPQDYVVNLGLLFSESTIDRE